jgi:hypothetical protein
VERLPIPLAPVRSLVVAEAGVVVVARLHQLPEALTNVSPSEISGRGAIALDGPALRNQTRSLP